MKLLVAQSYPTLCNSIDCSLPGSSVHGTLQARILQWVAMPSSRGSIWPMDRTPVSCTAGRCFTIWATGEAPVVFEEELKVAFFFLPACGILVLRPCIGSPALKASSLNCWTTKGIPELKFLNFVYWLKYYYFVLFVSLFFFFFFTFLCIFLLLWFNLFFD